MFDFFRRFFVKQTPLKLGKGENSYFSIHSGWGDHIDFISYDKESGIGEITGHLPILPRNGNILRAYSESKKIMLFEIFDMKFFNDPYDMFFAKVKFLGYSSDTYTLDNKTS